jgi:hypothetical protein
MRRFVCRLLLPAVVIVGLIAIGADKAEARRWIRRAPARVIVSPPVGVVVYPPAPVIVSPPVGVEVIAPAPVVVRPPAPVIVSPQPYYYRYYNPYWRYGGNVYGPRARVYVGPRGYGGAVVTPRVRVAW